MTRDPYRVLGLPRDATPAHIARTYRALVLALHPDTRREPGDPTRLAEVLAAYALLRDPERRAAYDAAEPQRRAAEPGPTRVPVRVRHTETPRQLDLRAGPVRWHRTS